MSFHHEMGYEEQKAKEGSEDGRRIPSLEVHFGYRVWSSLQVCYGGLNCMLFFWFIQNIKKEWEKRSTRPAAFTHNFPATLGHRKHTICSSRHTATSPRLSTYPRCKTRTKKIEKKKLSICAKLWLHSISSI